MYKKRYISPEDKKRYIFPEEKQQIIDELRLVLKNYV